MKTLISAIATLLIFLSITSCEKDDNPINCDIEVVISADEYSTAPNDELTINSLEINENCLTVNFSSGGCSGDTWELKLIDAAIILESNPPQRNLRLSLKNEESCLAYITKEITFDISELQIDGNKVLLNIVNSGDQILFEYE
ncbi:MAG: hypothetical protein DRI89_02210 [Bacteroidetes bacterium]|nr:MAG: hypothetical protein DRI89_02210 [Bacteroidota bacterium]